MCAVSKTKTPATEKGGNITAILTPHYSHCSEVPTVKSFTSGFP